MQVKDIMSSKVISISPNESAAVAARMLSRYNIGALPVCSKEGRLRGVVTDRDIVLRCIAADEDANSTKVSEIMTRRLFTVGEDASLQQAADLMAKEQIRRLPVERDGKLVGMVSLGDFAKTQGCTMEAAQALSEISGNVRNI